MAKNNEIFKNCNVKIIIKIHEILNTKQLMKTCPLFFSENSCNSCETILNFEIEIVFS